MTDELEQLFDVLDDEEEVREVEIAVGVAIPHVVVEPLPVVEQVEEAMEPQRLSPSMTEKVELPRPKVRNVVEQSKTTERFVRQVAQTQGKVMQSEGLCSAEYRLREHATASVVTVGTQMDLSGVPLGVDRAMERDARRYDGGF